MDEFHVTVLASTHHVMFHVILAIAWLVMLIDFVARIANGQGRLRIAPQSSVVGFPLPLMAMRFAQTDQFLVLNAHFLALSDLYWKDQMCVSAWPVAVGAEHKLFAHQRIVGCWENLPMGDWNVQEPQHSITAGQSVMLDLMLWAPQTDFVALMACGRAKQQSVNRRCARLCLLKNL